MVTASIREDNEGIVRSATELGFIADEDSEAFKRKFCELTRLITEPFRVPEGEVYDYGTSDLPKRAPRVAGELVLYSKLRAPPREIVFLDRKMGGVFIFLAVLKARLNVRAMLRDYLPGI
jgi:hypothetical protein